jgi:hypothetical protein
MTSPHVSASPMERSPRVASVLRSGILALIALIVGSMFGYDLVRSSPRTPLPRPRPNALGLSGSAVNPVGAPASRAAIWSAPSKSAW